MILLRRFSFQIRVYMIILIVKSKWRGKINVEEELYYFCFKLGLMFEMECIEMHVVGFRQSFW